jgi:short-subunit dehydrogenase
MSSVLILGARSDIAQAIAQRFGREGYDLILAARRADELDPAVKDLEIRHKIAARAVEFDALRFADHEPFYEGLDPKPDITICVFGLLGDQDSARHEFSLAHRIIDTNYTGAVSILGIVANDYQKKIAGTIIGISSVAGDRGRQSNYVYGSAKAGFTEFLAGLRNRLAHSGVHVMTVKPGFVATRMTEGMKLPGALTAQPDQVAENVFKGFRKKSNTIYTLWMWRYIMLIIRHVPEFVFKKLSM